MKLKICILGIFIMAAIIFAILSVISLVGFFFGNPINGYFIISMIISWLGTKELLKDILYDMLGKYNKDGSKKTISKLMEEWKQLKL